MTPTPVVCVATSSRRVQQLYSPGAWRPRPSLTNTRQLGLHAPFSQEVPVMVICCYRHDRSVFSIWTF
jgi:hypothetical protein